MGGLQLEYVIVGLEFASCLPFYNLMYRSYTFLENRWISENTHNKYKSVAEKVRILETLG